MNYSQNMTLGRRLTLAFGAVVLVLMGMTGAALYTANRLAEADRWNVHTYKVLDTATRLLASMINMETGARAFVIAGDDKFLEPWHAGLKSFEEQWSEAARLTADNPEQQRRLQEMKSRHLEFKGVVEGLLALRRDVAASRAQIADLIGEFSLGKDKAAMDGFRSVQAAFAQAESELLVTRAQTADAMRSLNHDSLLGGALLALVTAMGLGFWITRLIGRQLGGEPHEAARIARDIAQGNLATRFECRAGDETSLMASMKLMRDQLAATVSAVRGNAEGVATASEQIAQGNRELSQRTEQQASSLEETASSMEELGSTVKHNADNAQQANQFAQGASEVAVRGGEVVAQVVTTMQGIEESSRRIAEINNVIDSIAFQTNILALNAAVEAARAGEQGRGFAVVAAEVRTLAQRSAEAAKQIKDLITDSVERVSKGSALASQAGQTMDEVVAAIKRVNDVMGEISSASREQSEGVLQVGQAVSQMDHVTQQNAALVEESAAAADSLRQQAGRLVQAVSVFRLSDSDGHQAAAAPQASPVALVRSRDEDGSHHRAANVRRMAPRPQAPREIASAALAAAARPRRIGGNANADSEEWAAF